MNKSILKLTSEVQSALSSNQPIVALESTVIAHGLPRPQNLETAKRLESVVRSEGAIPATIAILDGELKAGLTEDEVKFIADPSATVDGTDPRADQIKKVSMRDLAIAVAQKWNGATTVASTAWMAHQAGIQVFATGGIGGVHRGNLSDVSADLPVLASTPMVVVCSGAKIVLDLPATREWLETYGITVVGYECDEMPAFYSRQSGLSVDVRVDSPAEVAQLFRARQSLGLRTSLLVTVPVPEEFEIPASELELILKDSLERTDRQHIVGRELTPFLLAQMAQASEGATLRANIALLENNARVAAMIAKEISKTISD